uniref:Protein AAR2 homolog n=1 Tax=Cuerna arida TaxID=1464854 RepID=A0A1B6EZA2_9HEMI
MALANITEETIEMDQELAKKLFVEGACFVVLDVPLGTEFGIDLKSWETAERFKGVKMIPPGLHFIYYSGTNRHGDVTPRAGFMHIFKKSEILVRRWDSEKEEISDKELPEETVSRIKSDIRNLDPCLGVYPYDMYGRWLKLNSYISEELLSRLVPLSGQIRSALEYTASPSTPTAERKRRSRPSTAEEKEDDLLPQLSATPGTELRLTPYPSQSYPEGASPQEITRHSLDPTFTLDSLLASYTMPSELMGELQFCFICFLTGYCLEALDQWKRLVRLLCTCQAAVCRRPQLYSQFLDVLELHLSEIPEDFLVDIVASVNLVYASLRELFRTMQTDSEVDGRLRSKAERFQQRLTDKFEWDFEDLDRDEDDEAPVIVEL